MFFFYSTCYSSLLDLFYLFCLYILILVMNYDRSYDVMFYTCKSCRDRVIIIQILKRLCCHNHYSFLLLLIASFFCSFFFCCVHITLLCSDAFFRYHLLRFFICSMCIYLTCIVSFTPYRCLLFKISKTVLHLFQ